jgi:hypothetical protein
MYVWVVRDPYGKWTWFNGGYNSYPDWDFGAGSFRTKKEAIADVESVIVSLGLGVQRI